MKSVVLRILAFTLLLSFASLLNAQTFPSPEYFQHFFRFPHVQTQLPGPQSLDEYIVNGKLRLSLQDAIRLMLLNNTEVRISQGQLDQSSFGIGRAYSTFDPVLNASFTPQRSTQPTTSSLQGAQTLSQLQQQSNFSYNQQFQSGTNFSLGFSTQRFTTNSSFALFNPSFTSGATFTVGQHLLRGRGYVVNHGPILIAQRNVKQARANFEAQLNDSILGVINQYWNLVEAQKNLAVVQDSLHLADESYKHDKRALELGALSPLDIYRSEATVAQRRLQVIQAEYAVKPLEDQFRRAIGADLDSRAGALDLELVENAEVSGDLVSEDIPTALETALSKRPELEAVRQQLANDDTSVYIAHNSLQPDLSLTGAYTSNGIGGNVIDTSSGTPVVVARGGLLDALGQVGGFGFPTYSVGLNLRLPIKNRSAEADLGSALVSKRSDLYQLRSRQQAITLEVRNAVHQLEVSKLSLSAAADALDLAKKTLAADQRKYELGAETIFFVLDAQSTVQQGEQSYLQAQIGYQLALAQLDHATGNLLEHNRVLIADSIR
ncbi:MAG TPA: TolC family protein [Terriglobales bacterium]|nr:TolC family protein [Terriglobales bacterium]